MLHMNEGMDHHKLTGDRHSHHHHHTLLQSRNVPEDTAVKHAAPVSKPTQPPADPSINVAPEEKKYLLFPRNTPAQEPDQSPANIATDLVLADI